MEKRVGNKKRARRHSAEFKASAVEQRKRCDNIVALSRELKVHGRMRYRWKTAAEAALEAEIARLKIALADPALELDFFRGAGDRKTESAGWPGPSFRPRDSNTRAPNMWPCWPVMAWCRA